MSGYAVAFMANDRYYRWALGFLESLRARNANIPLHCIPYGSDTRRIASLKRVFNFTIVEMDFSVLDAFADRLFPSCPPRRRNLRKCAALALPYDEVAYFDVDLLLTVDPARLFGHIKPGKLDLLYFSTSKGFAFKPECLAEVVQLYPQAVEFSTAAFISSPRALSIEQIVDVIDRNLPLYGGLRPDGVFDQPVFNFVVAHREKACAHIRDCDSTLAGMAWSRNRCVGSESGGPIAFTGSRLIEVTTGREVVAVHWAGAIKVAFDLFDPRSWKIAQFRSEYVRRGMHRVAQHAAQAHVNG